MGVFFAIIATITWGFGDFLIQKSTRKFGDWLALFYITAIGAIAIFPFIYKELPALFTDPKGLFILVLTSVIILFAALFDFEAFKRGKLAVIEPINAFELPIAAGLAAIVIGEKLAPAQTGLIIMLILGIFLVSTKSFSHFKTIHLERGVWLAVIATIGMGTADFLVGIGGRETSPLMVNWFLSIFSAIVCFGYFARNKKLKNITSEWRENRKLILTVGLVDNLAWVAYAYSMYYIPVAVATGISESYVALAAGLGIFINKEKIKTHQIVGLVCALAAATALAVITDK